MGVHCETTATDVLVSHLGLSEPMLFGLGSGLGFIYWETGGVPFLGGRVKPFELTRNLVERLGLTLRVSETSSARKAWQNVVTALEDGPVGLQLDSYHLEYFTSKIHFGGHFVAMTGYTDADALLVDTDQQGGAVRTSLSSLALARAERGPMTARNRSYTISGEGRVTRDVVVDAVRRTALAYLDPPISNLGHRGVRKAAARMLRWGDADLGLVAGLMERGGTGGSLFRALYRDFLGECGTWVDVRAYDAFCGIAPLWTDAAKLIESGSPAEASSVLLEVADREEAAMRLLAG
ncbi:lantibiotic ABC transporter [Lentzea sp. NBRC 105346]|uniref:BtrH N-terminal domain-containing protein n=1 Tax=Lentzea sp. NBRC 105346 TaxID=3032205 RepID=UPI0024A10D7B|nr:BtrH N-terminal domain-containing protein [Lentzea sp. NBRC 105346]GLZ36038.1 lantibiotic ABC transporter [Lentzea sp. NBRC 105346]